MSSASLVLVINCGSSSLKFSVIPRNQETPVLSGLAEKLGLREAGITFKDAQGKTTRGLPDGASHTCALEALFARLAEQALLPQVCAIGHRVAHGGNDFKHSVRLTAPVIERIRELSALAPLHNPANLIGIEAAMALLPELPQVAVFDTAFHQTLRRRPIPMPSRWSIYTSIRSDAMAFMAPPIALSPPKPSSAWVLTPPTTVYLLPISAMARRSVR